MKQKFRLYSILSVVSCVIVLMGWAIATPAQAHWADLAAAEISVEETAVQMTLTFPTGLAAFADDDRSGQLSPQEIRNHTVDLQTFLGRKIVLTDGENRRGALTIKAIDSAKLPPTVQIAPDTHSNLRLIYHWSQPFQGLRIHYGLFLPGVSTASCLATIIQAGNFQSFIFTPKQQTFAITPGLPGWGTGQLLLALAGAVVWGALHSLSPGHGKTVVGAYLVGERATPKHALFLALTTTITHTVGVFALGLVTLFAAQYILPEQIYPWLGVASGVMVASIGLNLLRERLRRRQRSKKAALSHDHSHHSKHEHVNAVAFVSGTAATATLAGVHSHDHRSHSHPSHDHAHIDRSHNSNSHTHHSHDHSFGEDHTHDSHSHTHHHNHSHLPPGADGSPITWRNLLALGISGGLVPCPAALVLLLGAIAFNQTAIGLLLVLAFSLGLVGVLTGLGLALVYARPLFKRMPGHVRFATVLPLISAVGITLLGIGIAAQAAMNVARVG